MIDLISLKKDGDGIYYAAIPERGVILKDDNLRYGLYKSRMLVRSLDERGLEFQVVRFQEGDSHYITDPEEEKREAAAVFRTTAVLVGIIFGVSS